jgi:uncharacterized membrane protein
MNEQDAAYSGGYAEQLARMSAFTTAMHNAKRATTPRDDYEALRERYVNGEIDLEEFAASVVAILKRGL